MAYQHPPQKRGLGSWLLTWQALVVAILGLVAAILGVAVPLLNNGPGSSPVAYPPSTYETNEPTTPQVAVPSSRPTVSTIVTRSSGSVPDGIIGSWAGTVSQEDAPNMPYPVRINLHQGTLGDEVGTSDYPTLECFGRLILSSVSTSAIVVTEKLMVGQICYDQTVIALTLKPNGSVEYSFSKPRGFAVLQRTP